MVVVCEHCKKAVENKNDLLVMRQWFLFPKPLHKACWGELASGMSGAGSVSYQTGIFQGKKRSTIPINSWTYFIIAAIGLLLGLFIWTLDFSGAVASNGQKIAIDSFQQFGIKLILFTLLLIPLLQRAWSYYSIEKQFRTKTAQKMVG